jgi:hypothetical protein
MRRRLVRRKYWAGEADVVVDVDVVAGVASGAVAVAVVVHRGASQLRRPTMPHQPPLRRQVRLRPRMRSRKRGRWNRPLH